MEINLSWLVLDLPGSTVCFSAYLRSRGFPGSFAFNDRWNFYRLRLSYTLLTQLLLRVFAGVLTIFFMQSLTSPYNGP